MIAEIQNIPVSCQICGGTAYGRESSVNTREGVVTECVWICSRCSGVTRRHTEITKRPNESEQPQSDTK